MPYKNSENRRKHWHERVRNDPTFTDKSKRNHKIYSLKVKKEVLAHYGGLPPKCAKCGYADIRALTIDHIDGGGNAHRKQIAKTSSIGFYAWLRRNKYPEGFQVLCMNDQFLKNFPA